MSGPLSEGPRQRRYTTPSSDSEADKYDSEPSSPTPVDRRVADNPSPLQHPRLPLQTPIPSLFPSPGRTRALSLPPLSSDGLIWSSPIAGTKEQRKVATIRKSQKKRSQTLAKTKAEQVATRERAAHEAEVSRLEFFNDMLTRITDRGYLFSQLMLHVFDPQYRQGVACYNFFRDQRVVRNILDLWVSHGNSQTGWREVHDWSVAYVSQTIRREASSITRDGWLQTLRRPINAGFVLGFDMAKIHNRLQQMAGVAMQMFKAFAEGQRYAKISLQRLAKKQTVITSVAAQLLGEHSHSNNFIKRIMTLYMYASGAQRQVITVISHLGLSESYNNLIAKALKPRPHKNINLTSAKEPRNSSIIAPLLGSSTSTTKTPLANPVDGLVAPPDLAESITKSKPRQPARPRQPGTLRQLSASMRDMARNIASMGLFATSYDNINMMFRAAEQIIGRSDSQENGTCATIWPLWKTSKVDLNLHDFESCAEQAATLTIDDILLNAEKTQFFNNCLIHCILQIIVAHGGEKFNKFREALDLNLPETDEKIELHRTPLYPLPAMNIDESTIIGNAEVIEAIFEELHIIKEDIEKEVMVFAGDHATCVKVFAGDQLSLARLRALLNIRAGQEKGYSGFGWGVWMPGLFHGKICDVHGMFVTHWGKPNCGNRNPGCLAFHNTRLHRAPIVLSSLPTFRVCRDLIFVSLYARVLHCLLLVSGKSSLDDYADSIDTWTTFREHGQAIFKQFANTQIVSDLRASRATSEETSASGNQPAAPAGDMVFENALLFLRDALITREFTDAIKCGDSGRVVLVLKIWALSFRGSGRTKYAHEMLHLIHNLEHVWPKPICAMVLNNWLVNPTGKPNSWVEVDLMQEHMNYWIKRFYAAHGSSASWDWLEMISPCVDVLRHLSKMMHNILGSDQGVKHEPANLKNDIHDLMRSLNDHDVYTLKVSRKLDDDDLPVTDIITTGLQQLTDSAHNPIDEYNQAFQQLQARRKLRAIIGKSAPNLGNAIPTSLRDSPPILQYTTPSPATALSDTGDDGFESGEEDDDDDVGEVEEYMDDMGDSEPTLHRETAEDVSLDMDADDYPQEDHDGDKGPDSDLEDDDSFDLEGLDGDNEVDMNIAH